VGSDLWVGKTWKNYCSQHFSGCLSAQDTSVQQRWGRCCKGERSGVGWLTGREGVWGE